MNGVSVQMIFSPQNCSLEILNKILTPDRRKLANRILAHIENSIQMNTSHLSLIIGPRGSGKTHVLAFIRHTLEAKYAQEDSLKVIRLSEEERGITSLLDFLLACFRALRISCETVASRIMGKNQDTPRDAAIDYFCEITGHKKTLIMVENLAQIFNDLEESAILDLRGFFQNNPFISILASSVTLFTKSNHTDHPFYGFFNIHPLQQLSRRDARTYLFTLASVKGDRELAAYLQERGSQSRVNAIYDLTGGNHRLLAMLSDFLSAEGLSELVGPFVQMADRELTPYYQQRLDCLSAQQNKLLRAIADNHGRALNVNEIARYTFLSPSTVSRQLFDLLHGEYVARKQIGRESYYELREPLLRLILDIKEGRDRPLPLIVGFLKNWYEIPELQQLAKASPEHARCYYRTALEDIQNAQAAPDIRGAIQNSFQPPEKKEQKIPFEEAMEMLEGKNYPAALERFEQLLKNNLDDINAWFAFTLALRLSEHWEESLKAYEEIISRFEGNNEPEVQKAICDALVNKGNTLGELKRYEEAISVYDQVIAQYGENTQPALLEQAAMALFNKGNTLMNLGKYSLALSVFDTPLPVPPDNPIALTGIAGKIQALINLHKEDEAFEFLAKVLTQIPVPHESRSFLSYCLFNYLAQDERLLKRVIEIYKDDKNSLVAGFISWIRRQIPLSRQDAEKLEDVNRILESLFREIPEAASALQVLDAVRKDALGDRKALLSLPLEIRQLVDRQQVEK